MADQQGYAAKAGDNLVGDLTSKVRDLEEKQKMLRDRLLLIGQNLVETKEKNSDDITDIKRSLEIMKSAIDKMTTFLENASEEFGTFARKEDLEILSKQAKMFQPLEFVRKKDLKNLINNE